MASSSMQSQGFETAPEYTSPSQAKDESQAMLTAREEEEEEKEAVVDISTQALWKTLHAELTNLGKSLTCPLCLSTYQDPVVLPCVHAYCRGCIVRSLGTKKQCPTCCQPATKRGLVGCASLSEMVVGYKQVLRSLGWTPIVYDPKIQMTQLQSSQEGGEDDEDDEGDVQKGNGRKKDHNLLDCHYALQVSKTWQRVIQDPKLAETMSKQLKVLQKERDAVVAVNETAVVKAAVRLQQQRKSTDHVRGTGGNNNNDDDETGKERENSIVTEDSNSGSRQDENTPESEIAAANEETEDNGVEAQEPRRKEENAEDESKVEMQPSPKSKQENEEQESGLASESVPRPRGEGVPEELSAADERTVDLSDSNPKDDEVEHSQPTPGKTESQSLAAEVLLAMAAPATPDVATPATPDVTTRRPEEESAPHESQNSLSIGTVVEVAPRTWPGINKPGGVGRITRVHNRGGSVSYDIRYVLGGREKQVDAGFVSLKTESSEEDDDSSRQPRKSRRSPRKEEVSVSVLQAIDDDRPNGRRKRRLVLDTNAQGTPSPRKRAIRTRVMQATEEPVPVEPVKRRRPQRRDQEGGSATKKRRTVGAAARLSEPFEPPTLSDEEKRSLADEWYETRFLRAKQQSVINVVSSSLNEHDNQALALLVAMTKAQDVSVRFSNNLNTKKATLVVAGANQSTRTDDALVRARTLKAMRAAACGVPIVNPKWIHACLEAKQIVAPLSEMYLRTLPSKTTRLNEGTEANATISLGVSLQAAHMQLQAQEKIPKRVSTLPFANIFVLLLGNFEKPPKTDVQLLLKDAGAMFLKNTAGAIEMLQSDEMAGATVVLLCDDGDNSVPSHLRNAVRQSIETQPKKRVLVVATAWMFDSVTCGTILQPDLYKPRSQQASELWELSIGK